MDMPPSGAMVALIPTPADAKRLTVPSGLPADELHLTLYYLGDADQYGAGTRQDIIAAVMQSVGLLPIITAQAFSIAAFNPDGDEPCIALGVGGDQVDQMHETVEQALDGWESQADEQHEPWVAHITLAYTADLSQVVAWADRCGPVTFDRVRVAFAGEVTDIPLAVPMEALLKTRTRAAVEDRDGWFKITNLGGSADVWIYDEIGFFGVTAADFVGQLANVNATAITCHINSPGGEVFDAIAIYNCLKSHPANITVMVDSIAASAASVIAMAGDRIVMCPGSQMMIHDAAGMCIGAAKDMAGMATLLERQSDNIAGFYAARAGGKKADWRAAMGAETWYTADEAVAAGLADEVSKPGQISRPPAAMPVPMNQWDLTSFRFAGRSRAPAPVLNRQASPPPNLEPAEETTTAAEPDDGPWTVDLAQVVKDSIRRPPADPTAGLDPATARQFRSTFGIPEPQPAEFDITIDPVEFYNAVREGITQ